MRENFYIQLVRIWYYVSDLLEVPLLKEHISNIEVSKRVVWLDGDCLLVVPHGID